MTDLEVAKRLVAGARTLVTLTGAGVSAESGVPTFRGAGGLWRERRPEELATPQAFAADPRTVWEWYGWRRSLVSRCAPNAAHLAIAKLGTVAPAAALITQNVDGLHQVAAKTAGSGATEPVELHGSLFRTKCTRCPQRWDDDRVVAASDALPACPTCGSLARPDVVWFGEMLDPRVLERATALAEACDLMIVAGTSGVVQPAAGLAVVARRHGARVIEVNPDETPLTSISDVSLRGTATALIPALLDGRH
jgi:NAD-dependent deacetylase